MRYRLDIPLKGGRDYIRGADVIHAAVTWIRTHVDARAPIRNVDVAFHRFARRPLDLYVSSAPANAEIAVTCGCTVDSVPLRLVLCESADTISAREPYSDGALLQRAAIDVAGRRVELRGALDEREIDVWVSLTRALHEAIWPQPNGAWFLVRARVREYAKRASVLTRQMRVVASRPRLTRSVAVLDADEAGELYFSRE